MESLSHCDKSPIKSRWLGFTMATLGRSFKNSGKKLYQVLSGASTAVATSCEVDLGDFGDE